MATEAASEFVEYLVFEPNGALSGSVAIPSIEVLEIGDDFVMGAYRDEFGIQYLQVRDISKQLRLDG